LITKEYKYEDIFQDIDDDPKNVLMNIPPEIIEKQGWKEGTRLKIEVGDQGTIIITELKDNQNA
tara:strand:+ start:5840 stop:6031 length:192 start_codon:yes stop_codon:yes gene_type:complete